ncbi:MAG: glycosyltransferase, partial [Gammaproteobacteria bacterium]|nr:glycosyltransferase [Gammaproteobacteria bacterium]
KLVLASDVGGHKELIQDGENGRLFKADDQASLVDTALDMIKNTDQWPLLRKKGRTYVEEERNWPVSVARYKPIYSRLV